MDRWQNLILLGKFLLYLLPIIVGVLIWDLTFENSRFRGIFTYVFHWIILLFGFILGKWIGVLVISLPLLVFYYYFLSHLAMVVVPASDPSDWREWIKRVSYFFFYVWGFQYPGWSVTGSSARKIETRIKGDAYNGFTQPGLVWAYSHQVVGLTTGITFSRVEAPGTVFTKLYEQPFDGIVDLRTQLRTFWIDVVSSDGIPFKALLFTSFAVDREKWSREILMQLLKEDRLLKLAKEPDYIRGSYPISRQRIRTLLSATGIRSSLKNSSGSKITREFAISEKTDKLSRSGTSKRLIISESTKKPSSEKKTKPSESETTYWDEMVLFHIEKAACEVLSQRRFDETWLPATDAEGACAADDIANAIKTRCFFNLLCMGIHFYSCRLVNFKFEREKTEEIGEVEHQQIAAWQADWQRESLETRAQGFAEAELLQQEARAYAWATLLTAVVDGLQQAPCLDPNVPRNMVAVRFMGALEEMLQRQPDGDGKTEVSSRLHTLRIRLSSSPKLE